jgi:hypothetical protein
MNGVCVPVIHPYDILDGPEQVFPPLLGHQSNTLSPGDVILRALQHPEYTKAISSIWETHFEYPSCQLCSDVSGSTEYQSDSSIDAFSDVFKSHSEVPDEIKNVVTLLRGTQGKLPKLTEDKPYDKVCHFIRAFSGWLDPDEQSSLDPLSIDLDDNTRVEIPQFFDFHLIRHMLLDDESVLLKSLAHTKPLDVRGGKRRCIFSETADRRFIIKSLLPSEFRKWEKNHRAFLWYYVRGIFQTTPSILVPFLGIFTIHRNHPSESRAYVIMRNLNHSLVYGSLTFDLKGMGPKRSKKQTQTSPLKRSDSGSSDFVDVLWDGDLRHLCGQRPIVVNEGCLCLIENSLFNDTLFLSSLDIVDYSMILCCREFKEGHPNGVIIVGIIDYLREYTWVKKIESAVKSFNSNLASVGSRISWKSETSIDSYVSSLELENAPTIISPDSYGRRFRKNICSLFTSSR